MKSIGSSQIAAVLDQSPYTTRYQLYQEAANGIKVEEAKDARMAMGVVLEPHIIAAVCRERGWTYDWNGPTPTDPLGTRLLHQTDPRASARPDAIARAPEHGDSDGILECKLVNIFKFWENWGRDESQPPMHIELQWQWQAYVTGATWGAIIVYIMGGDEYKVFNREPDAEVIATMIEANTLFWRDVEGKNEPDPFGDPKEVPLLALRYPEITNALPVDLGTDTDAAQIMADYALAQKKSSFWKKAADGEKAKLLALTKDNHETIATADDGRRFRAKVTKSKREAATIERKAGVTTRVTVKELEQGEATEQQNVLEAG